MCNSSPGFDANGKQINRFSKDAEVLSNSQKVTSRNAASVPMAQAAGAPAKTLLQGGASVKSLQPSGKTLLGA